MHSIEFWIAGYYDPGRLWHETRQFPLVAVLGLRDHNPSSVSLLREKHGCRNF